MKKTKKAKEPSQTNERIVTYVSHDMLEWVKREAQKMAINESAFIRYLLQRNMQADSHDL